MNPFLLFCFVSLCFSPVLAFVIGFILWYVEQFPEHRTPPPVPTRDSATLDLSVQVFRKGAEKLQNEPLEVNKLVGAAESDAFRGCTRTALSFEPEFANVLS